VVTLANLPATISQGTADATGVPPPESSTRRSGYLRGPNSRAVVRGHIWAACYCPRGARWRRRGRVPERPGGPLRHSAPSSPSGAYHRQQPISGHRRPATQARGPRRAPRESAWDVGVPFGGTDRTTAAGSWSTSEGSSPARRSRRTAIPAASLGNPQSDPLIGARRQARTDRDWLQGGCKPCGNLRCRCVLRGIPGTAS
jgi:hypothetical protein